MNDEFEEYFGSIEPKEEAQKVIIDNDDPELVYYDLNLLEKITAGLMATASMSCLHNFASTLGGIIGREYLAKLKKDVEDILEKDKPDWFSKNKCIDNIIFVNDLQNFFNNNPRYKVNKDYTFFMDAFKVFRERYITWTA